MIQKSKFPNFFLARKDISGYFKQLQNYKNWRIVALLSCLRNHTWFIPDKPEFGADFTFCTITPPVCVSPM